MATEGFLGYYVETRDYSATAAFWKSLGYESVFETDHESGQWTHPAGGPYIFIAEQHERELTTHPILKVADSASFAPKAQTLNFDRAFEPQHWGVVEAMILDPDGREVSLQAPQKQSEGFVPPQAPPRVSCLRAGMKPSDCSKPSDF